MFSGTAAAQNIDWATCGTSPPACSSTVTSCCTATAASLNFGAASGDKAIIIPMDRCHQRIVGSGNQAEPGTGAPAWCQDPSPANSDGMFHAYGLMYRMMQMGIPAYWIVNPTKHASGAANYGAVADQVYYEEDIDMWILHSSQTSANIPAMTGAAETGAQCTNAIDDDADTVINDGCLTACTTAGSCTGPVSLLDDALAVVSTYQYKEFPLRGSVFVIPGSDTDGDGTTDRAEFNTFWGSYGDGSPASGKTCASSNDCYNFTAVTMYEVNTTAIAAWKNWITPAAITGLPVAVKLNYKPPRIARVKSGGAVSALFLRAANLEDDAATSCKQGVFVRSTGTLPYEPVVCDLAEDDLYNNSLVTGNFGWAWFDGGSNFSSCSRALQSIRTFITGVPGVVTAGNVMVNDSRIPEFEDCTNHQLLGRAGAAHSGTTGALDIDNAVNEDQDNPWLIRYPTNLFAQYGDLPMDFASSSVGRWESGATYGYSALYTGTSNTLKRLLTREENRTVGSNEICGDNGPDGDLAAGGGTPDPGDKPHFYDVYPHNNATGCDKAADNEDVATYGRFNNDMLNGLVFYLPGNNLSNAGVRGELRMLLNSILATPSGTYTAPTSTAYEVSRATPIVPIIGGSEYIVQGTYVAQSSPSLPTVIMGDDDVLNWSFPYKLGHMRARLASAPTTVLLDAGCNSTLSGFACPAGSIGIPSTRTIFTNTAGGDLRGVAAKATLNSLSTAQKAIVYPLIADGINLSTTSLDTIVSRIQQGYWTGSARISVLGGVDRSTVAVIQASDVATGGTGRPMMAYFGAADGMMHAVCMETNAAYGCTDEGLELWAFMPRKQLPLLHTNTQRIDGSARVLDAYIDPDGSGTTYQTSWRTVLVFQTGSGDYSGAVGREPAVYALDITVPANPMLLWEYTDSATSTTVTSTAINDAGTATLGQGLTTSAGAVTISGTTKYMVWVDTMNYGTSGPGTVVTAINLDSGIKHRQVLFGYKPNPRTSTNDPVNRSGIPGGTIPLDLPSGTSSKITNIMVNDIYGRLWLLDPDTLVSVNGATTPMFTQTSDYYAMGPKPAVYSQGGSQYAVFTTGFYHDPANTTWPTACCKANVAGTACHATQPTVPQTCEQYNNSAALFPRQMAVAVKVDTAATTTYSVPSADCDSDSSAVLPACASTGFLFRRTLGIDERGTSQALVVGTDIFLSTERDNVNRTGYGTTGTSTGQLYQLAGATGTFAGAPTAVVLGAGAPAASNLGGASRAVYAGVGTFTSGSTTTTGSNVASKSTTGVDRKVWLRTE